MNSSGSATDPTVKYLALGFGLAGMVALGLFARNRPRIQHVLLFCSSFLIFVAIPDLNLASHEEYRGTSRGFAITMIDLVAVALAVALPRSAYRVPYRWAMVLYFIPCAVSVGLSEIPLYSAFELWKLVRMYFFVWVLAKACEHVRMPPTLLKGLAVGLVYEALLCVKMRYLDGYHQVPGSFSHQNSLGMAVNLVMPILFALLLRRPTKLGVAAVMGGAVCVVLTLSRGALGAMVLALGLTYGGSIVMRGFTRRKAYIAWGGAAAAVVILAKSLDQIVDRFLSAPEESLETREQFNAAAALMIDDHPLGVGFNMFSHALDKMGYAEQLGMHGYETTGVAHHIYWLTLAEVGWLGLLGYLVVIAHPLIKALRGIRVAGADIRGEIFLGCAAGLFTMYAQGLLEWIARQTEQSYLFWMVAALVVGLHRQLGTEKPAGGARGQA